MNNQAQQSKITIYKNSDGSSSVTVKFVNGEVWMSFKDIAKLYGRAPATISEHITAVLKTEDFGAEEVVRKNRTTASDGKNYLTTHYNLTMIIAIGYKVNSREGIVFRAWATRHLEHIAKHGYSIDAKEVSKDPDKYISLMKAIKEVRLSEAMVWRKLTDTISKVKDVGDSSEIFSIIQNLLHIATHGRTAPELILERTSHNKPNCGLTVFRGDAPNKLDITVAKNYLTKEELTKLEQLTSKLLEHVSTQKDFELAHTWLHGIKSALGVSDITREKIYGAITRAEANKAAMLEFFMYCKSEEQRSNYKGLENTLVILNIKPSRQVLLDEVLPLLNKYLINPNLKLAEDKDLVLEMLTLMINFTSSNFTKSTKELLRSIIETDYFMHYWDTSEISTDDSITITLAINSCQRSFLYEIYSGNTYHPCELSAMDVTDDHAVVTITTL